MRFVFLLCLSVLFSCSNTNAKSPFRTKEMVDTTRIKLDSICTLDILVNKTKNYTALVLRDSSAMNSLIGYGNTFPVEKNNRISLDTMVFTRGGEKSYLFRTYVNGSTFGAEVNYIIYKEFGWWNIFRIPFDKNDVRYDPAKKEHQILNFKINDEIEKHTFSNGFLTRVK
jgi:hypothetical protein